MMNAKYYITLLANTQSFLPIIHSLELQFKLGLFENPYVNIAEAEEFWDNQGNAREDRVAAGRSAMQKAMVLVKNAQ